MKRLIAGVLCAALLALPFPLLTQAQESPISLVVLGDSIAEGVGAILPGNRYANRIAEEKGYALSNYGKGGDTSASLLRKVREDADIRASVIGADIIAVSIGGNDFYPSLSLIVTGLVGDYDWMEPRRDRLREQFAATIEEIRALNPDALLIVQTLYNPVSALLPPSAHAMYDEVVQGINAIISGYLAANPGAYRIADVYSAFEGRYGLVSIDMVHPSARGHAVIAAVVGAAIDGTQPELPGTSRVLDACVAALSPVLAFADWALVGALRLVRSNLPRVWAWLTK